MNLRILTTLNIIIFLFTTPAEATTNKLLSEQGYPYDLLIKRTNEIKIIYSEKENMVNCRIELNWQDQKITTKDISIEKIKFDKKPFAACLPRDQAKVILAKTFN